MLPWGDREGPRHRDTGGQGCGTLFNAHFDASPPGRLRHPDDNRRPPKGHRRLTDAQPFPFPPLNGPGPAEHTHGGQ
jgi:hypothetical protein